MNLLFDLDGSLTDPGPGIVSCIEHALRSQEKEETLLIGERSHDIAGAQANGIRSVGVLWGYGSLQELAGAGADRLCASPSTLADCFPDNQE